MAVLTKGLSATALATRRASCVVAQTLDVDANQVGGAFGVGGDGAGQVGADAVAA